MCEKILVSRYINDQKEFPLSEDSIKDIVKYIGRVRFLFIEYKGFKADAVKNVIGTNIPIKQSFTAGMLELKRTDLRNMFYKQISSTISLDLEFLNKVSVDDNKHIAK
jgi:hypothetical protein